MPVQTNDLIVERLEWDEIQAVYPTLFRQIFSEPDPAHVPGFVYVGFENDKFVGFVSAYIHKVGTVYIQYSGFTKPFRGFRSLNIFKKVLSKIHEEFRYIIVHIENNNIPALKIALASGFRIIGVHVSTVDEIYVEFIRDFEHEKSIKPV